MTMYDGILAKSFSRKDQRKLGYGAVIACCITLFTFLLFKPYLFTTPLVNLEVSMGIGLKMLMVSETTSSQKMVKAAENAKEIMTTSSAQKQNLTSQKEDSETEKVPSPSAQEKNVSYHKEEILSPSAQEKKEEILSPSVQEKNITSHKEEKEVKVVQVTSAQKNSHTLHKEENVTKKVQPICNIGKQSDFCEMNGDIRIDGNSSTVYIVSYHKEDFLGNTSWKIKPYARKADNIAMGNVREWTVKLVKSHQEIPQCTKNHSIPAVLFSIGGYAGNHYHAISDILIPLFLTSRPFNREVQFLTTDRAPWVTAKFQESLDGLSKYKHITIDTEKDIHCFPRATIGLKHHKELGINATRSQYSMKDFREFLRSAYSLKRTNAIQLRNGLKRKPRLLLITRKGTRAFKNENEIIQTAKKLGFKVIVTEADSNLTRFAQTVNSCDVMMAVHGAGCTNIVFLPDKAIFIQVVGLGGMEWPSRVFYGWPAKEMSLKYLEYMIKEQESTLIEQYPIDHPVFKDPSSITKEGWHAFKKIYMDKQNVKLDIKRFRPTLVKALELLRQ